MKINWTRWLETKVKPAVIVGTLLLLIMWGLSQEAEAGTSVEIGAAVASGEYTEGQSILLVETFDKYSVALGYITDQVIEDRSGRLFPTRANLYIQGMRNVRLVGPVYGGVGVAYFGATNRALGCKFTATLMVQWRVSSRFTAQLRHYSNAGSCTPNMGQDLLSVGYNF